MWSVSVTLNHQPLLDSERFGHEFTVRIMMHHVPEGAHAPVSDPPSLVWNERVTHKEFSTNRYWVYEGNLYQARPTAGTFNTWLKRYVEAYNNATHPTGRPFADVSVQLLDAHQHPVFIARTPDQPLLTEDDAKAEYIQRLIQRMDCILCVEVTDRPALSYRAPAGDITGTTAAPRRRERLVLFECGAGQDLIRASQHLVLDLDDEANNIQNFTYGWIPLELPEDGLRRDLCDELLYEFRPRELDLLLAGERL